MVKVLPEVVRDSAVVRNGSAWTTVCPTTTPAGEPLDKMLPT